MLDAKKNDGTLFINGKVVSCSSNNFRFFPKPIQLDLSTLVIFIVGFLIVALAANQIAKVLQNRIATSGGKLNKLKLQNQVKGQTIKTASENGYVLPPSQINPSTTQKIVEGVGGKIDLLPAGIPFGSRLHVAGFVVEVNLFVFPIRHIVVVFPDHFLDGSQIVAGHAGRNGNIEMARFSYGQQRKKGKQVDNRHIGFHFYALIYTYPFYLLSNA